MLVAAMASLVLQGHITLYCLNKCPLTCPCHTFSCVPSQATSPIFMPFFLSCCRKAKGVEHMLVDALLEADKALHFSDKIRSAREFITLDDSLLKAIENFSLYNPGCGCRACTLRGSACACNATCVH